jgi:hypothetical protein
VGGYADGYARHRRDPNTGPNGRGGPCSGNIDQRGVSTVSKASRPPTAETVEGDRSGQTDGAASVTTEEVFELLSNKRRRFALHYLKCADDETEIGDLSERVASWENGTALQEVGSTERKRVYTSLQSHHLPKMDERGVVDYDERAGTVELTRSAEDLDVYLEVVEGTDVPWSQYYLGLAGVNAALVAGATAEVWPLGALPDIAWAAFVVTTLLVSAAVHLYHTSTQRLGEHEKPPEIRDR